LNDVVEWFLLDSTGRLSPQEGAVYGGGCLKSISFLFWLCYFLLLLQKKVTKEKEPGKDNPEDSEFAPFPVCPRAGLLVMVITGLNEDVEPNRYSVCSAERPRSAVLLVMVLYRAQRGR